jgi:hypothetical protein
MSWVFPASGCVWKRRGDSTFPCPVVATVLLALVVAGPCPVLPPLGITNQLPGFQGNVPWVLAGLQKDANITQQVRPCVCWGGGRARQL